MAFCKYCGASIEDGVHFCCHCGKDLAKDEKAIPVEDITETKTGEDRTQDLNVHIGGPQGAQGGEEESGQGFSQSDYIVPTIFSILMIIAEVLIPWLKRANAQAMENPKISLIAMLQLTSADSTAAIVFFLVKAVCIFAILGNATMIYVLLKKAEGDPLVGALSNGKLQMVFVGLYMLGIYCSDQYMRGMDPFNKVYFQGGSPEQILAVESGIIIYFGLALAEYVYAKVVIKWRE